MANILESFKGEKHGENIVQEKTVKESNYDIDNYDIDEILSHLNENLLKWPFPHRFNYALFVTFKLNKLFYKEWMSFTNECFEKLIITLNLTDGVIT